MISVSGRAKKSIIVCLFAVLLLTAPTQLGLASPTHAPPESFSTETRPSVAQRAPATGQWSIRVKGWSKNFKRGKQSRIDRCQATLWWGSLPTANANTTTWLAGHNYCGFWRWDRLLPLGSTFTITNPRGKSRVYVVFRRKYINRQSGSSAGLIRGDVTLQTCRGTGTVFVQARRLR